MSTHASRGHAKWSASSTAANWACPGRLTLLERFPVEDDENEAAAWGTACHEIAERMLRRPGEFPGRWLGEKIRTKQFTIAVDQEMLDVADEYVHYVRQQAAGAELLVEQKFSLAELNPAYEAGGTADASIYKPALRELEVVDLKTGRGVVVEVGGNVQLRTYALGALLGMPGRAIDSVKVTIVQPRAPHRDGRIRSEVFTVADLLEWTWALLERMRLARKAEAEYQPTPTWEREYLVVGSHCKFCPVQRNLNCPAHRRDVEDVTGAWRDDQDNWRIGNQPDAMDPAEIAKVLDFLPRLEDWIKAVRAFAHSRVRAGVEIPGYIEVERRGRETWIDDAAVLVALEQHKVSKDLALNDPKLRTPKQVRDALKKAGLDPQIVAGLSETPASGTELVRASETARPQVRPIAEQFFQEIPNA